MCCHPPLELQGTDIFLILLLGVPCASRVISRVSQDRVLEESAFGSAKDAPSDAITVLAKSTSCQALLSSTIVKSKLQQHFRITLELGRMVKLVALALL
jgi:hypothetical protein